MIKLVTWNVNSIKARLERALAFVQKVNPEILCLQELKCIEENFPLETFKGLGYQCAILGQKTYNGVAILSKEKVENIQKGFGVPAWDVQARWLGVTTYGIRIYCAYVPNGQAVGTEKYTYKLGWLEQAKEFLVKNSSTLPTAVVGDFNVAPEDRDVYDPNIWKDIILVSKPERQGYEAILAQGYQDIFRNFESKEGFFSWWDYRQLAFVKNHGLRIDLILGNEKLSSLSKNCWIERNERKGQAPSDHAPVVLELSI